MLNIQCTICITKVWNKNGVRKQLLQYMPEKKILRTGGMRNYKEHLYMDVGTKTFNVMGNVDNMPKCNNI